MDAPDNLQGAVDASVRDGEVVVEGEPYLTAERNINRLSPRHVYWVRSHDGRLVACARAQNARGETAMKVLRFEACKHIWRSVEDFAAMPDTVIITPGLTRPSAPPNFLVAMRQRQANAASVQRHVRQTSFDTTVVPAANTLRALTEQDAPTDFFRVSVPSATSATPAGTDQSALLHALLSGAREAESTPSSANVLASIKTVQDLQAYPQRALLMQFHKYFFPSVPHK